MQVIVVDPLKEFYDDVGRFPSRFSAVEMQVTKKMSGCDVSAFVLFEKRHVTLFVTVNAMCDTCRASAAKS